MKSLIVIVLGTWASWEATDLEANDAYHAILAPLGLAFFAAWGVAWLAARFGGGGGGDGGAGFGGFGDFGGGD